MVYTKRVDKLIELLRVEHTDACDSRTCDINAALNAGYGLWALYLFDSSGASSEEFDALYSRLPKSHIKNAKREANEFCDLVSHATCPHCNSVSWDVEHETVISCDSCCEDFDTKEKAV